MTSGAEDTHPAAFDPGESWSFRFDRAGQLMGIQFGDFSTTDADQALLTVGNQKPFLIAASSLGGGYWQAPSSIQFRVGETLRLEAIAPSEAEIKQALVAREELNQERQAEGLDPLEYTEAPERRLEC